ncbi:MAG: aminotransferase class I/II-fold pyridoxal phosphate-dependent enzyme [Actinobacteria bacterium]|nr:aminotransferase class I/II-fold pyridoxal phosphate-dependent enzyme [Actinomycetota bacterium]
MIEEPLLENLRIRSSEKWRRFSDEILPLPVAEMDFNIAPEIKAKLHSMVENSDTGYLGPVPELGLAFANFAADRWNWKVDPNLIRIASDVGSAIVEISRVLIPTGSEILINTPIYQNFANWIREVGCKPVELAMIESIDGNSRSFQLDFDGIERAYKSGVKAHFICNPHNPIGRVFTKSELEKIANLAHQYQVLIISDEIHGPLTYRNSGAGSFHPFLSISDEARSIGIAITSASKAWNLAGLKCAQFLSQSEEINEKLKSLPDAVHFRASLFGAISAVTAFNHSRDWLDQVIKILEAKSLFLYELLKAEIPDAYLYRPEFGFLGWIDLRALSLGDDPGKRYLTEAKVAFNSGHTYGDVGKGFVRLNFGTSDAIIEEAVARMKKVSKV